MKIEPTDAPIAALLHRDAREAPERRIAQPVDL